VTKYKVVNKKLSNQSHNVISRTFPVYSADPRSPNFGLYCKYQLLKYKPWHTIPDNAWGDQIGNDELYINSWRQFLQTQFAKENIPDWHDKMYCVDNWVEDVSTSDNSVQETPDQEEWMHLAELIPGRFVNNDDMQNSDDMISDWQTDKRKYTIQEVGEMPSWIRTKQAELSQHSHTSQVDVSTFSDMQRFAYNIIKTHSENSSGVNQLLLIIIGIAGTGKSYLIHAIRNLLQARCAITATTGKASYNISGKTIHSLLKLPVGPRGNKELSGSSLVRLQENPKHIDYILIDEYSMLGQTTFGWVDRRCRQATGITDELFGGKCIILLGDPGQLPPVGDKPLYHTAPTGALGEQGHSAFFMFSNVVKLSVNQRVQGTQPEQVQFRELLSRLRTGDSNYEDWELLLSRQPSKVSNLAEFQHATRLYFTNQEVADYNYQQLLSLSQPIATINALHSSELAKKATLDDMSGLEPTIFLAKSAIVMLTMNLWTDVGLCNGATGIVREFIYANNQQPPDLSAAVIVEFDDYRGPSLSKLHPSWVPICPIAINSSTLDGVHERQQLPLKLAWAMTIHKSQGLTLEKACINIGQTEKLQVYHM
jgi:hypothetical protein